MLLKQDLTKWFLNTRPVKVISAIWNTKITYRGNELRKRDIRPRHIVVFCQRALSGFEPRPFDYVEGGSSVGSPKVIYTTPIFQTQKTIRDQSVMPKLPLTPKKPEFVEPPVKVAFPQPHFFPSK